MHKEKEFLSLQKAKDIVLYFRTIGGHELKRFQDLDGSDKIIAFEKLENFIKSPEFREKQKMKPFTFRDTEEYSKFLEYKALKKDPEVKAFFRPKRKEEPVKTKIIDRFEELENFCQIFSIPCKKEYEANRLQRFRRV